MITLDTVQRLQFTDRPAAEALLLEFMRGELGLEPVKVELRPLAVSLNSFNGFLTLANGERLFFKTHTEADTVIGEYYHAGQLAEAGYPVLQPVYSSTEVGRQLLIYPVVENPSLFDVAWAIEQGEGDFASVAQAQNETDDRLAEIYARSLQWQAADEAAVAPVHQLFYHRLAGGRLARFYGAEQGSRDVAVPLGCESIKLIDLRNAHWRINGQMYGESLNDVIERALRLLQPTQAGPSVVGHGDAHNGNLFYDDTVPSLLYFDPAFAGRHSPLLDLAKPLFHNVFAMWMYFPHEKAAQLHLTARHERGQITVEHDYAIHAARRMFLESKVERVLLPALRLLKERGWLAADWRETLKAALLCCPLLTMNLADGTRFPPSIQVLGFAMAIEMGSESTGQRSLIDATLDGVEARL